MVNIKTRKAVPDPSARVLDVTNCRHIIEDIHETVFNLISKDISKNSRIFIAGSGQGGFEQRLINADIPASKIYSCDLVPEAFKLKQIKCLKCNFSEPLPYKNEFFDVVISIEVLEHLENPWYHIKEIHRVLRPNGILMITTPNFNGLYERMFFFIRGRFSQLSGFFYKPTPGDSHITPVMDYVLESFIKNKFTVEMRTYYGGFIKSRLFGKNMILKLRRLSETNAIV